MKKILLVCDVNNWAWHYKACEIRDNLTQYKIDIVYTTKGEPRFQRTMMTKYDHIHFFAWYVLDNELLKFRDKMSTSIASIEYEYTKPDKARNILPQLIIVAVSPVMADEMKKLGCKRIYHCYNGVNEIKFYRQPISHPKFRVGAACKPSSKFDLHGYNLLMNIKQELYSDSEIDCNFHIANHKTALTHNDMFKFYNSLDVFIHTGNYHLATPNPVFEAAACGIPIVATTNGCIPLLVKDGETGFLIDIKSNERLKWFVEKLRWLATNRHKCYEMGIKIRKEIELNWTWKQRSKDWIKVFET